MKTNYMFSTLLGLLVTLNGFAQSPDKTPEKQVRIKIVKDINGVQTTVDTTLTGEAATLFLRAQPPEGNASHPRKMIFFESDSSTQVTKADKTITIEIEGGSGTDHRVYINADSLSMTGEGKEAMDIRIIKRTEGDEQVITIRPHGVEGGLPADLDPEMDALIEKMRAEAAASGDSAHVVMIRREQLGDGEPTEEVIRWSSDSLAFPEDLDPQMKEMIEHARKQAAESGATPGRKIIIMEQESAEGLPQQQIRVLTDEDVDAHTVGERMEVRVIRFSCNVFEVTGEDAATLKQAGLKKAGKSSLEVTDLQFYPNPSNGLFTVKYTTAEQGPASLIVRDMTGKVVLEQAIPEVTGEVEKEIDLTSQARGTYFLTLTQGNRQLTKKIVIE